jgi:hypothetical protein
MSRQRILLLRSSPNPKQKSPYAQQPQEIAVQEVIRPQPLLHQFQPALKPTIPLLAKEGDLNP